jgi:hypothetical protein
MARTIVIGDIHGCYGELQDLLREVGEIADDRLVSVGDLVAKGPDNVAVLEFFRTRGNAEAVLGNHEYTLLRYFRGEAVALEQAHHHALAELGVNVASHMDWIARMPLYIELDSYLVVHAGIRPGRAIDEQTLEDLTELRSVDGATPGSRTGTPWFECYDGEKKVIFGHWVFDSPLVRKNVIGLDTGCVYGGFLSAVVLPEQRIVSVPARRAYAAKKG